jgi:hypothetical protein
MNFNALYEMYFWIFNVPYYKVMVVKDMEKIKYLVQKVATTETGKDIAIIDRALKMAWWTMPEVCFRDGKKFLMTVDIENAVPLVEDTKVITTGDLFIKEISITRLTKASLKIGEIEKSGKPKRFVEVYFPPTLLFEKLNPHFVKEVLKNPPSAWEEKKWAIIGVFICLTVMLYFILQSGVLTRMSGV